MVFRWQPRHRAFGFGNIDTNPEKLLAAGWSADFEQAMAGHKNKTTLPADLDVAARRQRTWIVRLGFDHLPLSHFALDGWQVDVNRFPLMRALGKRQPPRQILFSGLMNKQIANELSINEVTVKMHRGSAMRKLGVRSAAQLARLAHPIFDSQLIRLSDLSCEVPDANFGGGEI